MLINPVTNAATPETPAKSVGIVKNKLLKKVGRLVLLTLQTQKILLRTRKKANQLVTREQLKKKLPKKVMHQTLNVILHYLEDSGKILDGRKGILWIYIPSNKLNKFVQEGIEL